jgi:hypothetical protein
MKKGKRLRRKGLSKPLLNALFHNLDRDTFTFNQLKRLVNKEIAGLPCAKYQRYFSKERLEKAISKFVDRGILTISEENDQKIIKVNREKLLKIAAPPGSETGKAPSKEKKKRWQKWHKERYKTP